MQDKSFVKKVNKKSAGFTYRMSLLSKITFEKEKVLVL